MGFRKATPGPGRARPGLYWRSSYRVSIAMKARFSAVCALLLPMLASTVLAEDVDLGVIHRIKDQAFNHSKVMDYLNDIADENGPRVSGSPGFRQAAEKAVADFREAGVEKADRKSVV